MTRLIDTNIAIHLRDGNGEVVERVGALRSPPAISVITRIELEGGILRIPALAAMRRARVRELTERLVTLPVDAIVADAYGAILAATGYSRSRVADRMIAATAIVHGLTLITMNGRDFRDVPGLSLEVWPSA